MLACGLCRNPNVGEGFPNVKAGYEMKTIPWQPFDLVSEHYLHIGQSNSNLLALITRRTSRTTQVALGCFLWSPYGLNRADHHIFALYSFFLSFYLFSFLA